MFATIPAMSTSARVAIVIGLLCTVGAVLATLLPATADDGVSGCGTWVAPEYSADNVEGQLEDAHRLYLDARAAGQDGIAGEAVGIAGQIREASADCRGELGTRRTMALALVAVAIIGPVATMFVSGPRRQTTRT